VPTKSTIQTKVQEGDKLTILGEQDEYYKVKPPEGAYLFISKALVTPVKTLGPTATVAPQAAPAGPGPRSVEISSGPSNTAPRTRASEQAPVAPAPATMSADQMAAGTEYDKADADYTALADKPLADQPLDDLIARYTALTQNPNLPVTLRRTAQARLANLKSRQDAQKDLLAVQKSQQESNERLAKLRSEQQELAAKIRGEQFYTAVGTLLPSEIQQDGVNLYRLADPATSRTVVYVKPDPSLASYANNFVGVKGEVQTDAALGIKVLTPTAVRQVDPANVNNSVTAMMLPPSMLPSGGSGATTQP